MTYSIYTLGCKVNLYESNVISDLLKNSGYIEVKNGVQSDIVIVNTCTVTNTADNKSLKLIKSLKRHQPNSIMIACGCFVQSLKDIDLLDEIDIVIGNKNKSKIVDYLTSYLKQKERITDIQSMDNAPFEEMKLNNFNKTRAFVKIQDGCNNYCTYCIIPYVRGDVRSKDKHIVLEEIQALIDTNHHEIVLTGIHTGNYGNEEYGLTDLLKEILKIDGLTRLRISSIELNEITDEMLLLMHENQILVDHMHIPLQSGSNDILKLMNRKYDKEKFINRIAEIRKVRPNMSVTTDVIVGFPGETDEHFNETVKTINDVNFSKLHVFPYSKREGTKAIDLPNQIKEEVKKSRVKILLDLSKKLEEEYLKKFINKNLEVIFETHKDGYNIGHTGNYLLIKVKGDNLQNKNCLVTITEFNDNNLYGILTK